MNLKMNKLLVMLCIASVNCVVLQNLCSSHHFVCKGMKVNAFHVVPQNVTFKSLNDYLINDTITCDPSEFKDKANYWKVLRIKNEL